MYIGTAVSEVRSINITRPLESNTASYERSTASSCEQSILASHRALPGQQQQQLPRESFTLPIYYRNDVFICCAETNVDESGSSQTKDVSERVSELERWRSYV